LIENQETYQLWYEYLRANKTYEKMCMEFENFISLPEKERPLFPFSDWNMSQVINFQNVYQHWGNVCITSWEKTLSRINDEINQTINNPSREIVELKEPLSQYPSLSFKFNFHNTEIVYQHHIALAIPLNASIDDLVEQFREIVTKKQREVKREERPLFPLPSRKLSEDDIKNLQRYLKVYRLKEIEKLSWEKIRENFPDIHKSIHLKVWQRERDNARDIIENVSRNIFPGEYGQVKERKKRDAR